MKAATATLPEQATALSDQELRRNEPSTFTATVQLPSSFHLPPKISHRTCCCLRETAGAMKRDEPPHQGSAAVALLFFWMHFACLFYWNFVQDWVLTNTKLKVSLAKKGNWKCKQLLYGQVEVIFTVQSDGWVTFGCFPFSTKEVG